MEETLLAVDILVLSWTPPNARIEQSRAICTAMHLDGSAGSRGRSAARSVAHETHVQCSCMGYILLLMNLAPRTLLWEGQTCDIFQNFSTARISKPLKALKEGDLLQTLCCDAVQLIADLIQLVEDKEAIDGRRLLDGLELVRILFWQGLLSIGPSACILLPPPLQQESPGKSQEL